jgi:hypothetical protein
MQDLVPKLLVVGGVILLLFVLVTVSRLYKKKRYPELEPEVAKEDFV